MIFSRIGDHRRYVSRGETNQATCAPSSLPGHSLADLRVTIIENKRGNSALYRKEHGYYYIRYFDTYQKGVNHQKLTQFLSVGEVFMHHD